MITSLFSSILYSLFGSAVSYSTYLYHSNKYEEDSPTHLDMHFFIVKKLNGLESIVEKHAKNMYLSGRCIVEFNEGVQEISLEPSENSKLKVCSITNPTISKNVIDSYTEGYPPSYMFLLINSNPHVQRTEIQFCMKGVRKPQDFIRFVWPIASKFLDSTSKLSLKFFAIL